MTTLTNVIHAELAEQVSLDGGREEARRTVTAGGRAVAILDAQGMPLAANWNGLDLAVVVAGPAAGRCGLDRTDAGRRVARARASADVSARRR